MVWLATPHVFFFTQCVGFVGWSKNGMLQKQYVQTTRKVFGSGVVSVIKRGHYMGQLQDLVANQVSVSGSRTKFAVAVDRLVLFSKRTACDRAR